jgi:hypothetical protein
VLDELDDQLRLTAIEQATWRSAPSSLGGSTRLSSTPTT